MPKKKKEATGLLVAVAPVSMEEKEKKAGGGYSMRNNYNDGSLLDTPKVTDKEKEMYGEDAARYAALYEGYLLSQEKAETPEQLETIEKRFQQVRDSFDSNAIAVAFRLMDEKKEEEEREGLMYGGKKMSKRKYKYAEGSLMMPTESMPVDTYPNIPVEDQAAVEASQVDDDQMEEDYIEFVIDESLDDEEQTYLMSRLEDDPQLSQIFDKVVGTASEFSGSGSVEGPGTGVSDSIPARLSEGEFVFTDKATEQLGADNLQQMMDDAERAYDGGLMRKAYGGEVQAEEEEEKLSDTLARMRNNSGVKEEINKQMIASDRPLR